jgi:hypothetical protein
VILLLLLVIPFLLLVDLPVTNVAVHHHHHHHRSLPSIELSPLHLPDGLLHDSNADEILPPLVTSAVLSLTYRSHKSSVLLSEVGVPSIEAKSNPQATYCELLELTPPPSKKISTVWNRLRKLQSSFKYSTWIDFVSEKRNEFSGKLKTEIIIINKSLISFLFFLLFLSLFKKIKTKNNLKDKKCLPNFLFNCSLLDKMILRYYLRLLSLHPPPPPLFLTTSISHLSIITVSNLPLLLFLSSFIQ